MRNCDPTAFGLYLSWNEHETFNLQLDKVSKAQEQKTWLLLADCWRVAQEMCSNGFRQLVEQAMIDFAKARDDNFPNEETVDKMTVVVDIQCYVFYNLLADIWIFYNLRGEQLGEWDIPVAPGFAPYLIARLASWGSKKILSRLTLTVYTDELFD